MKQYHTICFCLIINFAAAQNFSFPTGSLEFYPGKFPPAIVYLESDKTMRGTIMKITDDFLLLSAYPNDTAKNKSLLEIPIVQIRRIKIKTDIALNMAGGAVATGLVGYGLGYITYSDDDTISDDDNKDRQHVRGALGALITAIPGAVLGMFVGLLHKQNFVINGSNKKMKKLMHALR